jgi:chitinase
MAYDFSGPWTPTAGHHAQLYSTDPSEPSAAAGVAYVKSTGFPPKKILLGIPVYGRSFIGAHGPGDAYTGLGGEDGAIEYKNLPEDGTDEIVDTARVAAFCAGGDAGFITYDNQETVRLKGEYCKREGLGGLFYWTGTGDWAGTARSLVASGFRALHG